MVNEHSYINNNTTKIKKSTNTSHNNIWSTILKGVASSKIIRTKNILVLGEPSSGKTTLIHQLTKSTSTLQQREEDKHSLDTIININDKPLSNKIYKQQPLDNKQLALGYTYTNIQDKDTKVSARLGIYHLSAPGYLTLLQAVLNMEMIKDTMILIVLDWEQPWKMVEKLQQWMHMIHQVMSTFNHEDNEEMDQIRANVLKYMQDYVEHDATTNEKISPSSSLLSTDQASLPLTEGVLTINYGVPLAVVCCKSDAQANLEKTQGFKQGRLDYIQQILRTICMKYGAALFYTSTSHPHTFTDLRQYILHRTLINASFQKQAQVMDRDTLMIPAGWDSWKKIKVLEEHFDCRSVSDLWDMDMKAWEIGQPANMTQGLQAMYTNAIHKQPGFDYVPSTNPSLILCQDEQTFLERHLDTLQRNGPTDNQHHRPGIIGPLGTSTTPSSLDILHTDHATSPLSRIDNIKDLNHSLKRLALDKLNKGSTVPLSTSASDTVATTSSISINNEHNDNNTSSSNEILNNFFQSLLCKKSASSSTSSRPSANLDNPSNSSSVKHQLYASTSFRRSRLMNVSNVEKSASSVHQVKTLME
ncbi:dynein light intermediate chain-domain-containing protein [Halteromyces radiatus]|uniref:dynein light intermediate chain-domain-containing protein n=1 Tax=Halteromyces radiatus TaxID=101107 RepID=UPI0022212534|nr:dynein light intermediate chain-domain-containing protein [Halteromyces radiatus]KAI8092780.1 dynein light intermediate chain-domain-containing protein [Halteromyces radiatus]